MHEMDTYQPNEVEKQLPHHQMVFIEGGSFDMGNGETDADKYEQPVHQVIVPSFYLAKYPVTRAFWNIIMDDNPLLNNEDERPMQLVSWNNAWDFIQKLNAHTNKSYRLPSEAEWEFAARGGKYSEGYLYSGSDKLKEVGWFIDNSDNNVHDVGTKLGNELKLYDMSGNVLEWVEDQWHKDYKGAPLDGSAWVDVDMESPRVLRGGSFGGSSKACQVSVRYGRNLKTQSGTFGFRLAMSLHSAT